MAKRAIYWNPWPQTTLQGHTSDIVQAQIDFLRSIHVSRIMLWVNDQPGNKDYAFDEHSPFAFDGWSSDTIVRATEGFRKADFEVALIMSPWFANAAYIESMGAPSALAEQLGVGIEFDMEGNLTDGWQIADTLDRLSAAEARALLIHTLKNRGPNVEYGISSAGGHKKEHLDIIRDADWFSPQSYGAGAIGHDLDWIEANIPEKSIWIAISAESSVEPALFQQKLDLARQRQALPGSKILGHVIWSKDALGDGTSLAKRPYVEALRNTPPE